MFQELMHYCVVTIGTAGICSLSYESSLIRNFLFLSFWSGNVYYQVCLGSGPRGLLLPKKLLSFHCVTHLTYTLEEASSIIALLSAHWDRVLYHLNRVSRLPTFRYHMREVVFRFWHLLKS